MHFIDLFAGLGGFNLALSQLGHQCVFASEINEDLRKLYFKNFGLMPQGDIRNIDIQCIPKHDILCAGFPCQPFSKAGSQAGLTDPVLGDLYKDILRVVNYHKPTYLFLENVPNLKKHDEGKTWAKLESLLRNEGYDIKIGQLSPHDFGIPQIRKRVYIVGKLGGLGTFSFPVPPKTKSVVTIDDYLDENPSNGIKISDKINTCLKTWQEFLDNVPKVEKIPHPLWAMEFGATYPYKTDTPSQLRFTTLVNYRGSFGQDLYDAENLAELFSMLPSHARRIQVKFPKWKVGFIQKNRRFYHRHKEWLDDWIPKIRKFPSSYQKLEWNCTGEKNRNIWDYIIQIRPSGVRIKRRTTAPSLVAMNTTQIPIIAREKRYMTVTECLRIQSMDDPFGLKHIPESKTATYKALGNAINVKVAKLIAQEFIRTDFADINGLESNLSRATQALNKVEPLNKAIVINSS